MAFSARKVNKFLKSLRRRKEQEEDTEHFIVGASLRAPWVSVYSWASEDFADMGPKLQPADNDKFFVVATNLSVVPVSVNFRCDCKNGKVYFGDHKRELMRSITAVSPPGSGPQPAVAYDTLEISDSLVLSETVEVLSTMNDLFSTRQVPLVDTFLFFRFS